MAGWMKPLWIAVMLAGALGAAGVAGSGAALADDVVVIACDRNFAPYTHLDADGEPQGMLVDVWRLWAEKTGVEVRFRFTNWEGSIQAVRTGGADVHSGLFPNPERAEWFEFSRAFYRSSTGLFVPVGSQVRGLADVVDGRVGAIEGSDAAATLQAAGVQMYTYPTPRALLKAARGGRIEAFADERAGMLSYLRAQGMREEFLLTEKPLYFKELVAAVRKGRPGLLSHINQGLGMITPREIEAIEERWIGRESAGTGRQP